MPSESSAARKTVGGRVNSLSLKPGHSLDAVEGCRVIVCTIDGAELCCQVEQFNETGAYLLRSEHARPSKAVQTGDHVAIHIVPVGAHGSNSIIIDGSVIRVEDDGPGIAIRFTATQEDEDHTYNDLSSDDWMTEVPERNGRARLAADNQHQMADLSDLGMPNSSANTMPAPTLNIRRVVQCAVFAATISVALASFVLFGDWLRAVGL